MTTIIDNLSVAYPILFQILFGTVFVVLGALTHCHTHEKTHNDCKHSFKNPFYSFGLGLLLTAVCLVIIPTNASLWLVDEQFSVNFTNETISNYFGNDTFYNDYTGIVYNSTIGVNSLTSLGFGFTLGALLSLICNTYCFKRQVAKVLSDNTYKPSAKNTYDPSTDIESKTTSINLLYIHKPSPEDVKYRANLGLLLVSALTYLIMSNALLGHQLEKFHVFSMLYIAKLFFRRVPLFYMFGSMIGKSVNEREVTKCTKTIVSLVVILVPPIATLLTYYFSFEYNTVIVFMLLVASGMLIHTSVALIESNNDGLCQSLMILVGAVGYTFLYSLTQFRAE